MAINLLNYDHSLVIPRVWIDIPRVWLDIPRVWLDIRRVRLDIPRVWLDIPRVWLDTRRLQLDIRSGFVDQMGHDLYPISESLYHIFLMLIILKLDANHKSCVFLLGPTDILEH